MLGTHLFDELQAVFCHLPRLGKLPPHANGICEIRVIAGKTLDGQPPVKAHFGQGRKCIVPWHMAGSRGTAVILTNVHVAQHRRYLANGIAKFLFFYVGMVSVKHGLYMGMVYFLQ